MTYTTRIMEILEPELFYLKNHPEAYAALTELVNEARISELENLLPEERKVWIVINDLQSHEQVVNTNLIRDRISALKAGRPE